MASKTVKLEEQVYRDLDAFRGKRETFSEAVERLLNAASLTNEIKMVIEGGIAYENWRKIVKMEKELDKGANSPRSSLALGSF